MKVLPKKALGQHWLKNDDALKAMCDAGEVNQGDTVLEIGPGPGALTEKLLDQGADVVAVELDEYLASQLVKNFKNTRLTIIQADIFDIPLTSLPKGYKIVANIPYYITSKIVKYFLECSHKPSIMALLMQKEVARRLGAGPGNMSLLSLGAQLYADVTLGEIIPAGKFLPPPKVDSQIVTLQIHKQPKFPVEAKSFFRLAKAGFGERRKKLRSALAGGLHMDKGEVEAMLDDAGIAPATRAQELSLRDWYKLYRVWQKKTQ